MKTRDVFCSLAFASVSIDGPGRSRLCCNNQGHWNDESTPVIAQCDSTDAVINTALHKAVRVSMQRGQRHPSCVKCWDLEDMGARSFRQIWNDALDLHDMPHDAEIDGTLPAASVRYLDITLGNKCNLVCRMCNWANSHLWVIDDARLGRPVDADQRLLVQDWFEDQGNLDLLTSMLGNLTHMNFLGGEPLIVRQHLQLLDKAIDLGKAKDIELSYNSNLTHVNDDLIKTWQHFKSVRVNASIEAVGDANDYIRQNSTWQSIMANIDRLKSVGDPVILDVHATFGTYNALEMPSLMQWSMDTIGRLPFLNVVRYPSHQDVRHMPDHCKHEVQDGISSILAMMPTERSDIYHGAMAHMAQTRDQDEWLMFWSEADAIDRLKARDMRDHLPRLWRHRP